MSVEIRLIKQRGGGIGFTFPLDMEITKDLLEEAPVKEALERIAELLVRDRPNIDRSGELRQVVGVTLISLTFNYLMDTVKAPEQQVAEKLAEKS